MDIQAVMPHFAVGPSHMSQTLICILLQIINTHTHTLVLTLTRHLS